MHNVKLNNVMIQCESLCANNAIGYTPENLKLIFLGYTAKNKSIDEL